MPTDGCARNQVRQAANISPSGPPLCVSLFAHQNHGQVKVLLAYAAPLFTRRVEVLENRQSSSPGHNIRAPLSYCSQVPSSCCNAFAQPYALLLILNNVLGNHNVYVIAEGNPRQYGNQTLHDQSQSNPTPQISSLPATDSPSSPPRPRHTAALPDHPPSVSALQRNPSGPASPTVSAAPRSSDPSS
jgi:hypothetical protein